ncbi:hypothetical protein BDB00DRAFT_847896 [Zychaea mexicana]|uniref:uncharacterized protein n=1 Tax=Zychaea mexicana TaxID=64656 RepID=UPI0022FEC368|nr:uncharacterized protein BDB00DRAFT_847896 [Zychaea mexicana]KAI9488492.1 hypothetical protein BDB00DRAFT_847896 [Zychaea mexicana]
MAPAKPVRIGCYSAYWGDSPAAAIQLVKHEGANLDYLVADYLAEITMGILAARRKRRMMQGKEKGIDYVPDFLSLVLRYILPDVAKNGTKVVTNAGALDPIACKEAIEKLLKKMNIDLKVAAVVGDDVLENKESETLETFAQVHPFSPISSTEHSLDADPMPAKDEPILSLNAYLGSRGVAAALAQGAQIIVTGRVVDSALVVGPLMHEYGWQPSQPEYHDRLASASLAGHIIECGCHSTGGNFTDWRLASESPYGGYANMGYPIVEFSGNGEFVVTKPEKTGGLVSPATVAEQILYEILDPALYLLPDVILDMRQVRLSKVGENRVLVQGAKGRAPTPWLKCSGIFLDGWKLSGELVIGGHEAKEKALAVGNAVVQRVQNMFKDTGISPFRKYNVETLGGESLYGPHAKKEASREIVLRLTAHHDETKALGLFARELMAVGTCMAPGITGSGSGRPKPVPNLVHFPCLLPKSDVKTSFVVGDGSLQSVAWEAWDETNAFGSPAVVPLIAAAAVDSSTKLVKTKLINLANGRSGDKGDVCNVGIIARDPRYFPYIKRTLTSKAVADYMSHLCKGSVTRFELPGLYAMNFVLTKSLGGGGLSSLVIDRQGKTFAQLLLTGIDIEIPADMMPADQAKL